MITYQLVCILVALLVTGVLVRCETEDSQPQADTSPVEDSKPETEDEEDLQTEQTGHLWNSLFGKFESLKGKSFYNFGFPGKSGCYRDPCYPYYGGGAGGGVSGGFGGGGGGGGSVYYKYVPVPVSYGGSYSTPASYYYYYQDQGHSVQPAPPAPAPAPPAPAPQPSYYYVIGVPVSRPTYKVAPQPIPYRPVYQQPTIHCTTSPCGNVQPYYGYGTGGVSAGGQFVAGSSISGVESQAPAGGGQEIIAAASVPVLKGFTASESFPEVGKPAEEVQSSAGAVDGVKC